MKVATIKTLTKTVNALTSRIDSIVDPVFSDWARLDAVGKQAESTAEWNVGDKVHLGFGAKGGAGFDGVIEKMEGNFVFIKNNKNRTFKGPIKHLSKEQSDDARKDAASDKHSGNFFFCKECDKIIAQYEKKGLSHGDAQGAAQAVHMKATKNDDRKDAVIAKPNIQNSNYLNKPDDQLRYIIKDATEARRNADEMGDRRASDKYSDQINDAVTVLNYRKKMKESGRVDDDRKDASGPGQRTDKPENVSSPKYNAQSVNKAIASSPQKIGKKEGSAIHRLLKGRHSDDTRKDGGPGSGRIAKGLAAEERTALASPEHKKEVEQENKKVAIAKGKREAATKEAHRLASQSGGKFFETKWPDAK